MMDTFFPSCTPRCTTVCRVPARLRLSVSVLARTGGTVSLRSGSGAGMMAPGLDKVAHPVLAAHLLVLVLVLFLVLLPLLPACSHSFAKLASAMLPWCYCLWI